MSGRKRMIDGNITESWKFLNMGKAAQALYMHLILNTDDDGVCEAGVVLRVTNTRKTALQELVSNDYVTELLPEYSVVYINGWQSFNTIDTRYGRSSIYRETLREQFPGMPLRDFKPKTDNELTSAPRISEGKLSEDKLVEDKLSEAEHHTKNTGSKIPTQESIREKIIACGWSRRNAETIADNFFNYNAKNGWKGLEQHTWRELLDRWLEKESIPKGQCQHDFDEIERLLVNQC